MTSHRKPLTDLAVSSAKSTDRQYEIPDGKVTGLSLRVAPGGARTFALRYRTATGEQRRLTLGRYPVVTLAHARDLAMRALAAVADGEDPAKTKRTARAAGRAGNPTTLADLIEICLKAARTGHHRPNGQPQRQSTLALEHDAFERLIKPRLGEVPIADLTQSSLQAFLDDIYAITPAGARNCHALIRLAFNVAIRRELTTLRNPAQFISLPRAPTRERVLNDEELGTVWRATEIPAPVPGTQCWRPAPVSPSAWRWSPSSAAARSSASMPASSTATSACGRFPASAPRTTGRTSCRSPSWRSSSSTRPSPSPASNAWQGYAFPSPRGATPITRHALSHAVGRLMAAIGIADATAHDFRRTGATNLTGERLRVPRFIVSRVLNQISDTGGAAAVTSVYDRNEYLSEKRQALDAWASRLHDIVSGEKRASNIVSLGG